jgi:hypothetical protein
MHGIPLFNYPAFHKAAATLRDFGYTVINPAENHDGRTDLPLAEYFKLDLPQVCESDGVVVLPGWRNSKGAGVEVHLAEHLNKPVLRFDTLTDDGYMKTIYETATEEAERLVHGPRGVNYGHPIDDFSRTGRMWGAILGGPDVPPELVGLCMAAVKISREVNAPKRDNRVDLAGYAETIEMIARARENPFEYGGAPGPKIDERVEPDKEDPLGG